MIYKNNKLIRILFVFLFSLGSLQLFSQEYTATQLLDNAKNGFLLFRLPTLSKKIDALQKAGRSEEANDVRTEIRADQLAWLKAFESEYNYGKVYFFYDYDAHSILAKDFSVVFDWNGNYVENLGPDFVVAGPDQTETFSLDGILLLTPEMEDVPKKMPRYISAWGFAHLNKKSYVDMVAELNAALKRYN